MESFNQIEAWTLFLLGASAIGTSVISGIIGMAGGVTLLGILTFFLPFQWIIPIHGVVQLVSNSTRAFLIRNEIKWPLFYRYTIGAIIGTIGSTYVFSIIENKTLPLLAIGLIIIYSLFKPKKLPPLNIPDNGFFFLGLVAGFLSLFVGAVGPFLAPFFLRPDFSKKQVVATKAAFQFVTHILKLPAFFYIGFVYLDHFALILLLSVSAVIGTHIGVNLLHRINGKVFFVLFRIVLFGAALRIFYKVFLSLNIV